MGLDLSEPPGPLPVIIFADEHAFKLYGPAAMLVHSREESKGYYPIRMNRIALYDLTAGKEKRARSVAEIKRRTAASAFNMATIVHEATHQIAFNSGLHLRFADNPLWLAEGMAMYFEAPDRTADTISKRSATQSSAVRSVSRLHPPPAECDSLATLVSRTDRFTDSLKAADAYAEAWASPGSSPRKRPQEYVAYLKQFSKKPPLIWDEPATRLADFKSAFGENLPARRGFLGSRNS